MLGGVDGHLGMKEGMNYFEFGEGNMYVDTHLLDILDSKTHPTHRHT
jgi:hypothetical protein